MNFKTCKNLQNTNVSCLFMCCCAVCAKCCSAAQFVCMLFQYRHRISNNLKIFVQLLNVATIPFQLYFNFNKAFCDYSAFPNFQIVYPFRISQVVRFSREFFSFYFCIPQNNNMAFCTLLSKFWHLICVVWIFCKRWLSNYF